LDPDRILRGGAPRRAPHALRSFPTGLALAALFALSPAATPARAAHSLETFVLTVGGNSHGGLGGCTTFMNPAPVGAFFNGGVGIPLDGLATCGVAGDFRDLTSLAGPLADSHTLSSSWIEGVFAGSTDAHADYGDLSATGHSVYTGSTSSTSVVGSEGFGRCNETLTITSPGVAAGQPGTVRFLVTVTGGLSTTTNGTSDVELNYRYGATTYTMFRSQVNNVAAVPFMNSIYGVGLAGFTAVPGSMSGSGQPTTFAHPIVFGTPFDIAFGLFAYALPGVGTNATADSHFHAYLSGIVVTGPSGQSVTDFTALGSSGTTYASTGIAGVGEPSALTGDEVRLTAAPNPATRGTRLSFRLPPQAAARLDLFDASGRRVRRLQDGTGASAWWDGRDDRGTRLPGGAYYARLRWDGGSRTATVVLMP
jgi:hypothetical protein